MAPSNSVLKKLLAALCALAALWLCACAAIYAVMRRPPEQFGRVMAKIPAPVAFFAFPFETLWVRARAGNLNIGDRAPDFTLAKLDHTGRLQLSALTAQGQPVVLVFGSYT